MGAQWTTKEQRNHLVGYRQQFAEVQSSKSARTAFIDKVLKEFEAKWGADTWTFDGMVFEGAEDKILDSKRGKMFDRIEKWFYNHSRDAGDPTSGPSLKLLPLLANVRGIRESNGRPRHRMAKVTDKYYELIIEPDVARRNLLSYMYEAYKAVCTANAAKPGKMFNWRGSILADWLAEEHEDVRKEVHRARKREMGFNVEEDDKVPIDIGSTPSTDASAQTKEQHSAERQRLERAQMQDDAIARLPASLFTLAKKLEGLTMAKGIILLGAPVPNRDGKIMIFKRNIGTTLDTKDTFESLVGRDFQAQVLGPFADFLVKAFPQDIAEQMSLKSALDDVTVHHTQGDEHGASEQSEGPTAMGVIDCTALNTNRGRDNSLTASARSSGAIKSKETRRKGKASKADVEGDISSDESDGTLNLSSSEESSDEDNSISNKPVRSARKTPYELERDANIRRNAQILKDLGLDSVSSLLPSKNSARHSRHHVEGPANPTRRSARVSNSGADSSTSTINVSADNTSASLSGPSTEPQVDLQSVDPQTASVSVPQDESLLANKPASAPANEGATFLTKGQGLPVTDPALDEAHSCQLQAEEQNKEFSVSLRQPGVEIMVPLGVRSSAFEAYLEERQRSLDDPGHSTCAPVELLPPGGIDDKLFQVFHLQDVKPPEFRPKAEWICKAEELLCKTFSGKFAKLAVRYWIQIEEKLEYPGSKEGFSTEGRPAVLAEWFKYGRKYEQTPKSITDLAKLGQAFIKWWVSLQPLARRVQGVDPSQSVNLGSLLIRPAKVEAGGWSRLSIGGKNGIFLVFLLLVWYKRLAQSEQDLAFVELALYDVCWALDKVLEDLKTCGRRGKEGEVPEQHKRSANELEDADESQSGHKRKARKKQRPSEPLPTARQSRARA